ncbi:hypothetical protein BJX70DRAFT_397441 [Aspergillus crustosus]
MAALSRKQYQHIKHYGLWGTFEDGQQWLSKLDRDTPKCILSLGSMFGNDEFDLAVQRMRLWREVLETSDLMFLGMDARCGDGVLEKTYHDAEGGAVWYRAEYWALEGVVEEEPARHRFKIRALTDVLCEELGLVIKEREVVEFFESLKYGPGVMGRQFEEAGMVQRGGWRSPLGDFYGYLVSFAE